MMLRVWLMIIMVMVTLLVSSEAEFEIKLMIDKEDCFSHKVGLVSDTNSSLCIDLLVTTYFDS